MKFNQTLFVLAVCLGGVLLCTIPGPSAVPQEDNSSGRLLEKYADARVKLAEVELRRANEFNARMPKIISTLHVERLRCNLEAAREQAAFVRENQRDDLHQLQLKSLATNAALAVSDLDQAKAANLSMPGVISDVDIERLSAIVEITQLRLKLAQQPGQSRSSVDLLQWHMEQLTSEVMDLQNRVEQLSQRH